MNVLARVSMKIQLLVLGGLFVVLIMGIAVATYFIDRELGRIIHFGHDINDQTAAVTSSWQEVTSAKVEILKYSTGGSDSLASANAALDSALRALDMSRVSMRDVEVPEAARPGALIILEEI